MLRATVKKIGTDRVMAAQTEVPHFVNDKGVDKIKIGVKEFQCMGAAPPHDHPHVYLDMGHDAALSDGESDPPSCVYVATSPPGAPAA
jgi:uncharacterized Zn-finger protein